jgi:hypothetical protein
MSLPISPGQRRAVQWFVVLIGILVVAVLGVPRATVPFADAQAAAADGDPYPWLAPCSKMATTSLRLLE